MSGLAVQLGNRVRDMVSGMEGIAIARAVQINGNVRFSVQPPAKETDMPKAIYFDEALLEVVDEGLAKRARTPPAESYRFALGSRGRDRASGVEGLIFSHATYLDGCVFYELIPRSKDIEMRTFEVSPSLMVSVDLLEPVVTQQPPLQPSRPSGGPPTYDRRR